jgi:hypothetical protein
MRFRPIDLLIAAGFSLAVFGVLFGSLITVGCVQRRIKVKEVEAVKNEEAVQLLNTLQREFHKIADENLKAVVEFRTAIPRRDSPEYAALKATAQRIIELDQLGVDKVLEFHRAAFPPNPNAIRQAIKPIVRQLESAVTGPGERLEFYYGAVRIRVEDLKKIVR